MNDGELRVSRHEVSVAPTRVFLARHGETVWNLERRYQGHGDSPLTAHGLEQAHQLADRLRDEAVVAVYTSDLVRARHTAHIVAQPHGIEPIPHAGLREIDTGRWTGLLHSEVRITAEREVLYEHYRDRRSERPFPSGEARTDVQRRALAALYQISTRHAGQSIVVISHRVTITTILAHALAMSLEAKLPGQDAHCSLSVLDVSPGTCIPVATLDACRFVASG